MTTPRKSESNQNVDPMGNPAIHDWYANIMTGLNITATKELPGSFGAACKELNGSLDAFGKLNGPPDKWDNAVERLAQELAIIAYKNNINIDAIDPKNIKKIRVDSEKGKTELNKDQIQLYSDLIKRDWINQRVKDKLIEINKNPEIVLDIRKTQKEKAKQNPNKTIKESTPTSSLNPFRWMQKRVNDYWEYTKANPLKSIIMTGTALLGIGLFIAGTVLTLGVLPGVVGGIALLAGAAGAGVGVGALVSDIRHQTQEKEMENLSPDEVQKKQKELAETLNFNTPLTSTANLANKLFTNPIDKKEALSTPHPDFINDAQGIRFSENQTKSPEVSHGTENKNNSSSDDDEMEKKSLRSQQ
jgi:hypothetical protein